MISVIIPAYNEAAIIPKTVKTISSILKKESIEYEIIFVNDGSKDNSTEQIRLAHMEDYKIKGICFSRNFGKEAAMMAGLEMAKGDCAVIIDCDLQHPPEKIVDMYRLWKQGFEVVEGIKVSRGTESRMHKIAANCFYGLISKAIKLDMSNASDFKLLDRKVINVLIDMPEKNAFFRALSSWVGFKVTTIEYAVRDREVGETKWSTKSLIKYAINNITSFSAAPLQIVTVLGIMTFVISLILSVVTIVQKIMGVSLGGFTTVIIMQGFTCSVIMISLGIIGYYLEKIYEEIKNRPRYIITNKIEDSDNDK